MDDLLVLWDLDYTLLNAGGVGAAVYREVFRDLFGRELSWVAPMAGRTERAIILDTLTAAGVSDPAEQVDAFVAELAARAPALRAVFADRGHALPGAATALAALATLVRQAQPAVPASPVVEAEPGTEASRERAVLAGPVELGDVVMVQSVLTGNIRAIAEAKLGALGLADYLDLEIGAYGEYHEIRAELVHLARRQAARMYGRDFAGCATVLIGDTPLDVGAALATGARAIGVATGASSVAELMAAGAHTTLPDLTDTESVIAAVLHSSGG